MIALMLSMMGALLPQEPPDPVAELRKQLKDEATNVRIRAVRELTKLKAREAAEDIRALLKDPEWEVRYSSVGALEAFNDKEAAPLVKDLFRDAESTVVIAAIRAIGNWSYDPAFEEMLSLLKHAMPDIRQAALVQFASARYGKAAKPAQELLKDPDRKVQIEAVRVIGAIPWAGAFEDLLALSSTDDPEFRAAVIEALRTAGTPEKQEKRVRAAIKDKTCPAELWSVLAYWGVADALAWYAPDALKDRPLWILNRIAAGDAVLNLRSRRLSRGEIRISTVAQLVDRIAKPDLKVEWSATVPAAAREAKLANYEALGRQPSCEAVLVATGLGWKIEGGILKMMSRDAEIAAWKAWLAEQK